MSEQTVNKSPSLISTDELLQRIGVQVNGYIWTVLIVDQFALNSVVEELSETIGIFSECDIKAISVQGGTATLLELLEQSAQDYLILWGFETWSSEEWNRLNAARSQFAQTRGGLLVLSSSVNTMLNYAPHFFSWVGSRAYELEKNSGFLTDQERETRLSALREWSGRSDSEVIESAACRQLPALPEYGEWLILLGRGDLIDR
jgi:hypothetical protein